MNGQKTRRIRTGLIVFMILCTVALLLTGCGGSKVPKGQDCIENGAFATMESSLRAEGWYFDAYAESNGYGFKDNAGPNGERAIVITNESDNDARLVQKVACKSNTTYKFTVWCKTEAVGDEIDAVGANLSVLGAFYYSDDLKGDNDWTQLTFYGKTALNQTSLEVALRLGFYSGDNTGTAYFTGVTMVEIDANTVPSGASVADLTNQLSSGVALPEEGQDDKAKSTSIILIGALFAIAIIGAYFLLRKYVPSRTMRSCILIILVAVGLIIRIIQATSIKGFEVDVNCFWSWGQRMLQMGPLQFYSSGFCDYPPLYMLFLAIPAAINNAFALTIDSEIGWLVLKSPALLADIFTALFIYRVADKKYPNVSLLLAGAYLLNPAVIVGSASWGQVDSILTLFLVLAIYYIIKNKMWLSVVCYGIALLCKPQALMFAPVMLVGAICFCFKAVKGKLGSTKAESLKPLWHFLYALGGALLVFVLLSVVMQGEQEWYWLFTKYFGTMTSYQYGTLSAFNLMGLLGGQWTKGSEVIFAGITYNMLGYFMIAVVIGLFIYLYYKKHQNRSLFLMAAFLMSGIFCLAHYMHERYLFPVLALLLLAFVVYGDRRILYVFAAFTFTTYVNIAQVLYLHYNPSAPNAYFAADDTLFLIFSGINVLIFLYFSYVVYDIQFSKKITEDVRLTQAQPKQANTQLLADELLVQAKYSAEKASGAKKRFLNKKDWLIMLGVTLVYAAVTLVNLGSMNTPEKYWEAARGEQMVVDFGQETNIQRFYVNSSICNSSFTIRVDDDDVRQNGGMVIEYSTDGENWTNLTTYNYTNGDMFKWENAGTFNVNTRYLRITAKLTGMRVNEMILFASEDALEPIAIASVTRIDSNGETTMDEHGCAALFDEQYTAVTKPSYYTGMIFDEIYHARTAYEMINGWQIYEWTHPPLGKAIMSLGIRMFGMNPFGWRFMGNLMGILMLPAMYCFGKLLFKKTSWATALMMLMTLDGMHFIQTRLATIDSYGVFFIILMYLFMYKYYTMNWNHDKLWKTFIPLGLSGICFGLGIASKWIGAYAGVGLAIIFFYTLYRRYREMSAARAQSKNTALSDADKATFARIGDRQTFTIKLIATIGFCLLFFVIVPFIIYCASYGAYFDAPGNKGAWYETVLKNQTDMFSYHKGILDSKNHFQSPWYQWPIMWHPYWYYQASELPTGIMGTISCMGNPLIWWFGLVSALSCFIMFIRKLSLRQKVIDPKKRYRLGKDIRLLGFAFIGLAVNYGAWMLIGRTTYIYHYFASLPFIMIFTVYLLRQFWTHVSNSKPSRILGKNPKRFATSCVVGFFAACLVLSVMFYPVWTGIEVSKDYVRNFLWWIPSYWDNGHFFGWHFFN